MENNSKTEIGDIINLSAVADASSPERRETTLQKRKVVLTAQNLPRFVDVELPNGKKMERVATSPRDLEWSASCTILRDKALVVSPWHGAEAAKTYTIEVEGGILTHSATKYRLTLPYPVMGVRAPGVRELAFICENAMGTLRLPREQSGSRKCMTPRDQKDKSRPARNYRSYPVATDCFVAWFETQLPLIWRPIEGTNRHPWHWILMTESLGPWGKAIDDNWIEVVE